MTMLAMAPPPPPAPPTGFGFGCPLSSGRRASSSSQLCSSTAGPFGVRALRPGTGTVVACDEALLPDRGIERGGGGASEVGCVPVVACGSCA